MRGLVYAALILGMLLIPVERNDVGKLCPIEVISIYRNGNEFTIETDTGDKGKGDTAEKALQNLKETTAGIVYIDTAEYLLVRAEDKALIRQMIPYMKESVKVYAMKGRLDPAEAAAFLAAHQTDTCLKEAETGKEPPVLVKRAGKLQIEENTKKDEKRA